MVSSTFSRTASNETPERLERFGRDTLTLVDQAQENVFRTNKAVVQQARFLLCKHKHPTCPVCESFEHTASIRG